MSSTNRKFNSILSTCCGSVDSLEVPEGMTHAVSAGIGPSKQNKSTEVELLGEKVLLERIGTDGSMGIAAQLYGERDGKVDASGAWKENCGGDGWMQW